MKNNKAMVWRCYGTGTGGYRLLEPMNEAELAAHKAADQQEHREMVNRRVAQEARLQIKPPLTPQPMPGCVFSKSCHLPDAIIDYHNPTGYVPLDRLADYGEYALLGGREADDSGLLPLGKISGSTLPAGLRALALGGTATRQPPRRAPAL